MVVVVPCGPDMHRSGPGGSNRMGGEAQGKQGAKSFPQIRFHGRCGKVAAFEKVTGLAFAREMGGANPPEIEGGATR